MAYRMDKIIGVVQGALIYYDEHGTKQSICLKTCSRNFALEYNANLDDYITWEGEPAKALDVEANKCVGNRDWYDEMPYFEFFTSPKSRFEIKKKKFPIKAMEEYANKRYYKKFYELQVQLYQAGWTTFDLG